MPKIQVHLVPNQGEAFHDVAVDLGKLIEQFIKIVESDSELRQRSPSIITWLALQRILGWQPKSRTTLHRWEPYQIWFEEMRKGYYHVHVARTERDDDDETLHYFVKMRPREGPFHLYEDGTKSWVTETKAGASINGRQYVFEKTSPLWPWIALEPEKFAQVMRLHDLLTPGDSNPLTGIITSRTTEVRTLAKQVAGKLEERFKEWALEIVNSL